MNPDNGTTVQPHVGVVISPPPPQLIKYLENLDQRLQEEQRREIHEQFRNVRCFQHILGTSTGFKLIYDKCKFSLFMIMSKDCIA